MLGGFREFTIRDHVTAEVCLIFDDIIWHYIRMFIKELKNK